VIDIPGVLFCACICSRTVSSVADSVKKFSGAVPPGSPEPSRVAKPKPASKKPDIKGEASPALETKASGAARNSGGAKGTAGESPSLLENYM